MENVLQGTSLGEWTSLESATVTLPTLNPTWKRLFVKRTAHSTAPHARGNLALVLLMPHVRTAVMENVLQGTSLGEWTSLESATVTLPTLNPTWKRLFVKRTAHSTAPHARGNLALVLLTPHVRTAVMENVPQSTSLGEWTSPESATVTLPTLSRTWHRFLVITAAHSGTYHARGNLALVLLTPHVRTAALENVP